MDEWYWQGKAEVLVEETFPVPLYPPQIPSGLLESNPGLLGETADLLREVVPSHCVKFNVLLPYRIILYARLRTSIRTQRLQ
jgi:hypothetical protein